MSIETIPLSKIAESSSNPRKTYDKAKLDELAASIRAQGVLQPVLVRPRIEVRDNGRSEMRNGYELVIGSRRYRAAKAAGLDEIPAVIREMDDAAVVEAQVVENDQREDVHPLEEADGYRLLIEKHGRSVDDVAVKVGRSRAYVYARLKLCELGPDGRKAYLAGKLTASTALYLARVPAALQKQACGELTRQRYNDDEPLSAREAAHLLRSGFMLDLKSAPFDPTNRALVPKAGACGDCPKRTGNQAELFGDVGNGDVCTDPTCFKAKVDAEWVCLSRDAAEIGLVIVPQKGLFSYGDSPAPRSGYQNADEKCWSVPGGKAKTYAQLAGKDAQKYIARSESGSIVRLVATKDVNAGLRALGASSTATSSVLTTSEKRRKAESAIARRVTDRCIEAVIAKVVNRPPADIWRHLARAILEHTWHDAQKGLVARRELDRPEQPDAAPKKGRKKKPKPVQPRELIAHEIDTVTDDACRGLAVELALARSVFGGHGVDRETFAAWGVDVATIEREEKAAAKKEAAAKKAKKRAGKKR